MKHYTATLTYHLTVHFTADDDASQTELEEIAERLAKEDCDFSLSLPQIEIKKRPTD